MNRIATNALRFFFLPVLLVLAGWVPMAYAQDIIVDTTTDELDSAVGNGSCSLREAISNANSNTAGQDDCTTGIGTDTIVLEAGKTYTLSIASTGEDANVNGDLDITDTAGGLTIETNLMFGTATIDADGIDRVIEMHDGPLTLVDLIITGGAAGASNGGGIRAVDGDLTLTRCTVGGNTATDGGGIVAQYSLTSGSGTLTIAESTIGGPPGLGNTASVFGGGLTASGASLADVRHRRNTRGV